MSNLDLRAAFDSGNVFEKNVALRKASDCIEALKTENKALREFVQAVIRYAGTLGDDYLADKARALLAKGDER